MKQSAAGPPAQPLLSRDSFAPEVWGDCEAWLEQAASKEAEYAALVLGWYRRRPRNDSELAEKLSSMNILHPACRPSAREMLTTLGNAGRRVLEKWDAEEKQRQTEYDGR